VLGALRAVLGFPLAVAEPAGHRESAALGQVLAADGSEPVPDGHVDVDGIGGAVTPVDREPQRGDLLAGRRGAKLGGGGQVPNALDAVQFMLSLLLGVVACGPFARNRGPPKPTPDGPAMRHAVTGDAPSYP